MVATQIFLCSHLFGEDFPSWPIFFRWVEGNHQPEKVNLAKPKSSKKTLGWWKIQKKIPWIPPFSWTCWSKTCAMFALFQKSEDVCGGENPWRLWDLSEKCSRTKKMWQKVCRNLCWINERLWQQNDQSSDSTGWLTRTTTAFQQKGDFEKLHAFFPQKQWCFRIQMF